MPNLTQERDTRLRAGDTIHNLPVAAGAKLLAGSIAGADSAGLLAAPARGTKLCLPVLIEETADNAGGAAGAVRAKARRGVVGLDPGTLTQASVGRLVYLVDDHTASVEASYVLSSVTYYNTPAGILLSLDDGQAWVDLKSSPAA